jgi:hypothetical protein
VSIIIDKDSCALDRKICAIALYYTFGGLFITGIYWLGYRIINYKVYINFDGEM